MGLLIFVTEAFARHSQLSSQSAEMFFFGKSRRLARCAENQEKRWGAPEIINEGDDVERDADCENLGHDP